jgi:hypothetical protein
MNLMTMNRTGLNQNCLPMILNWNHRSNLHWSHWPMIRIRPNFHLTNRLLMNRQNSHPRMNLLSPILLNRPSLSRHFHRNQNLRSPLNRNRQNPRFRLDRKAGHSADHSADRLEDRLEAPMGKTGTMAHSDRMGTTDR